jgi:hypothetical protein
MGLEGTRTSHVSAEMAALVGREFPEIRVSFPIDRGDIRRWAMAVYYPELPPRIYWDEEAAAAGPYGGIVAPEEFNPFAWLTQPLTPGGDPGHQGRAVEIQPDALIEGRLGAAGPGLSHYLNGSTEVQYGESPLRPGDVITARSFHGGYAERAGKAGLMLFTTTETRFVNQRDESVKIERKTLIRY